MKLSGGWTTRGILPFDNKYDKNWWKKDQKDAEECWMAMQPYSKWRLWVAVSHGATLCCTLEPRGCRESPGTRKEQRKSGQTLQHRLSVRTDCVFLNPAKFLQARHPWRNVACPGSAVSSTESNFFVFSTTLLHSERSSYKKHCTECKKGCVGTVRVKLDSWDFLSNQRVAPKQRGWEYVARSFYSPLARVHQPIRMWTPLSLGTRLLVSVLRGRQHHVVSILQ